MTTFNIKPTISSVLLSIGLILSGYCLAADNWHALSTTQQQALAPAQQHWNQLPDSQKQPLLDAASRFDTLSRTQQQRFHQRLEIWVQLTPEQRKAARDKYQAFHQIPEDMQQEVKQLIRQNQ